MVEPAKPRALPVGWEIAIVFGGVALLTFVLTRLRDAPGVGEYVHLAVGGLFLVTAMGLARREPNGMQRLGIDLAGVLSPPEGVEPGAGELGRTVRAAMPTALREIGVALALVLVIFPPFAVGFRIYHGPSHPFVPTIPDDLATFAVAQVLIIGLPEEALFRGYFQTRLSEVFPRTVRIFGADVSLVALVIQAALFAVIHFVVDLSVERLAVFFPGLVFGWLRAFRGGIGASILFHAMSNVYADLLVRGWL